jgi:hypothetical protein
MALTGKFTSAKRAIDRVYQDAGLEVNLVEAVEWIGDVLDLIGAPIMYKTCITNGLEDEDGVTHPPIDIISYRGELPVDLHKIVGAIDFDTKRELYEITDIAYKSYQSQEFPNMIPEGSYTTNNSHIFTSYETGRVEMVYSAYKLDEFGLPMIPEDTKVVRAVTSYITERLDYRAFRVGRVTPQIYQQSKQDRHFDIGAATMRVDIPSIDGMESWKRVTINLMPRLNLHATGFRQPAKNTYSPMGVGGTNNSISSQIPLDLTNTLTHLMSYSLNWKITEVTLPTGITYTITFVDDSTTYTLGDTIIGLREILITVSTNCILNLYIQFI